VPAQPPSWNPSLGNPLSQQSRALNSALSGLQLAEPSLNGQVVQGVYTRAQPSLPPSLQQYLGTSRAACLPTLPVYTAQNNTLPTRQTFLPLYANPELYGRSTLKDLLGINECQPPRQGEGLLLPINFCSHVRGSREEEEILKTPAGSRLFWEHSNSNKKITPEKLNQGLFFGANARILARLIPNLSPELTVYLDYLRQLGDLLINYTSTSVYSLDHEHRYEVAEMGRPWNEISTSLSLNWLKKKENVNSASSANSTARAQGRPNSLFASNAIATKSQVICYLYNQQDGCPFGATCKFVHKCSVDGCPESHPSFKHTFRAKAPTSQQPLPIAAPPRAI
jgi:hypothetical protein